METNFYPLTQRRLRADEHIRELAASVRLSHKSFIQPLFVDEAISAPREVNGLNDVQVETIDSVLYNIEQDLKSGISKDGTRHSPACQSVSPVSGSRRFRSALWNFPSS